MADFRGMRLKKIPGAIRRFRSKDVKHEVSRKRAVAKAPTRTAPTKPQAGSEHLAVLRDFRDGLTSLRDVTRALGRLQGRREPGLGGTPAIPKNLERLHEKEVRTIHRLTERAVPVPGAERLDVRRDVQTLTRDALSQGLPQTYAAVLQAARQVRQSPPQKVARPEQAGSRRPVTLLERTAAAIKSGKFNRVKDIQTKPVKEILRQVLGDRQVRAITRGQDIETRRLIEEHRLIPLAAGVTHQQTVEQRVQQGGTAVTEREKTIEKLLHTTMTKQVRDSRDGAPESQRVVQRPAPPPTPYEQTGRLEQAGVPRFATQGARQSGQILEPEEMSINLRVDGALPAEAAEGRDPQAPMPEGVRGDRQPAMRQVTERVGMAAAPARSTGMNQSQQVQGDRTAAARAPTGGSGGGGSGELGGGPGDPAGGLNQASNGPIEVKIVGGELRSVLEKGEIVTKTPGVG